MKEGWILYYKNKYEKNTHYCDLYMNASKKYAFNLKLMIFENLTVAIENNSLRLKYMGFKIDKPNFIINRTNNYLLAELFEMHGIQVFNNSYISRICNDKRLAYSYVSGLKIPIMDTYLYKSENDIFSYPYVKKDAFGSGGNEVFLINNAQDEITTLKNTTISNINNNIYSKAKTLNNKISTEKNKLTLSKHTCDNTLYTHTNNYLYQGVCKESGKDVRVYVVGTEIICSVLRIGKNDFRSNYSLGGDITIFNLSEKQKDIVYKIIHSLNIGMVGIDFLYSENDLIFNEIEDSVGARSLYKLTNINIVDLYCKYIKKYFL